MTRREKLLERFRKNDKNVRFDEIDRLLIGLGFERRSSGSHFVYRMEKIQITIPQRKPFILPVYVKNVLRIIDELLADDEK
jgi:predicted RNA binding protein YcfA (HicA-like mRNA interferase family)